MHIINKTLSLLFVCFTSIVTCMDSSLPVQEKPHYIFLKPKKSCFLPKIQTDTFPDSYIKKEKKEPEPLKKKPDPLYYSDKQLIPKKIAVETFPVIKTLLSTRWSQNSPILDEKDRHITIIPCDQPKRIIRHLCVLAKNPNTAEGFNFLHTIPDVEPVLELADYLGLEHKQLYDMAENVGIISQLYNNMYSSSWWKNVEKASLELKQDSHSTIKKNTLLATLKTWRETDPNKIIFDKLVAHQKTVKQIMEKDGINITNIYFCRAFEIYPQHIESLHDLDEIDPSFTNVRRIHFSNSLIYKTHLPLINALTQAWIDFSNNKNISIIEPADIYVLQLKSNWQHHYYEFNNCSITSIPVDLLKDYPNVTLKVKNNPLDQCTLDALKPYQCYQDTTSKEAIVYERYWFRKPLAISLGANAILSYALSKICTSLDLQWEQEKVIIDNDIRSYIHKTLPPTVTSETKPIYQWIVQNKYVDDSKKFSHEIITSILGITSTKNDTPFTIIPSIYDSCNVLLNNIYNYNPGFSFSLWASYGLLKLTSCFIGVPVSFSLVPTSFIMLKACWDWLKNKYPEFYIKYSQIIYSPSSTNKE